MASGHICPAGSAPVDVLAWPPFADPGRVVRIVDGDGLGNSLGRVRHVWRCCGTAVVQFLRDPETGDTYSDRLALAEMAPPLDGIPFWVPCAGSDWSLHLPCGHVAGEGCDCELIALEAADQTASPCWCGALPEDSDEPCAHS